MKTGGLFLLAVLALCTVASRGENDPERSKVVAIIARLQRADYEGDQRAMQKSFDELAPFMKEKALASRVHYWRGFAMWRRAINGFNDSVDRKELGEDLEKALEEFRLAAASDPKFADAKIAIISCLGYQGFLARGDPEKAQSFFRQTAPLIKEAKELAPENPRLFWVLGPILWNVPPERGGGQEKAIANYEKALAFARRAKPNDALEPSWGEPELLMNLAWSQLNRSKPEIDAAERNARAALKLVPYWHYVRDILLPQILAARAKSS